MKFNIIFNMLTEVCRCRDWVVLNFSEHYTVWPCSDVHSWDDCGISLTHECYRPANCSRKSNKNGSTQTEYCNWNSTAVRSYVFLSIFIQVVEQIDRLTANIDLSEEPPCIAQGSSNNFHDSMHSGDLRVAMLPNHKPASVQASQHVDEDRVILRSNSPSPVHMASVVKTSRFTPPNLIKDHEKPGLNGHPPHLYPSKDSNHTSQARPEPHPQTLDPKVIIGNSTSNLRTQKPPPYPQNGRCGKGPYPPPKPVRTPAYPIRGRQSTSMVWRRRVVSSSAMGAWNMRPCCSDWRSKRDQAGEQLMVRLEELFFLPVSLSLFFYNVDVSVRAHCWLRWLCLLAAQGLKAVNELQRSSLFTKKDVCVWYMCFCVRARVRGVCVWAAAKGLLCVCFCWCHMISQSSLHCKTCLSWQVKWEIRVHSWVWLHMWLQLVNRVRKFHSLK